MLGLGFKRPRGTPTLTADLQVLEYSLFCPGLFTNYMTYPYRSSKHINLFEIPFNFNQRRALICEGGEDDVITLTSAQDTAKVVALAVEYQGEWPIFGGIRGARVSMGQLFAIGERVRGKLSLLLVVGTWLLTVGHEGSPFAVERLNKADLQAGVVKASWRLPSMHPSIPPEQVAAFADAIVAGFLLGISAGNLDISDEWNRLLPDYAFTQPEEFLSQAWAAIDAGAKSVHTED